MIPHPFWLFVLAGSAVACAGATPRNCSSEAELASLEAAYIAEAVRVCEGETYDSCVQLPALREKYRARRRAWMECTNP